MTPEDEQKLEELQNNNNHLTVLTPRQKWASVLAYVAISVAFFGGVVGLGNSIRNNTDRVRENRQLILEIQQLRQQRIEDAAQTDLRLCRDLEALKDIFRDRLVVQIRTTEQYLTSTSPERLHQILANLNITEKQLRDSLHEDRRQLNRLKPDRCRNLPSQRPDTKKKATSIYQQLHHGEKRNG